ncbi:hypothetical protein JWG42_17305, partial [Desulfoprunum benzoelyticum]|uniref:hypothetical protein n=1 Tax=Desulfoprunum benzoelyticum TaxID=1506996 RepID=UPI0019624576
PAVITTCPRCHLDLPPLSSQPTPAVISTFPRCHLDRRERSQTGLAMGSSKGTRDFSLRLEMTEEKSRNDSGGVIQSFALPETRDFSPALKIDLSPFA